MTPASKIDVTLAFTRRGGERNETYSYDFTLGEEEAYHIVLEKVEQMLVALGYVPDGHLDFVSSTDNSPSYLTETPSNVTTMFTINP